MAGSLESAFRLLHDQLGVVSFGPYRQLCLQVFSTSRSCYPALASTPPLFGHPHRNWKEAGAKAGLPAVGVKLSDLVTRLQVRGEERGGEVM